jgi:hypothetical protein
MTTIYCTEIHSARIITVITTGSIMMSMMMIAMNEVIKTEVLGLGPAHLPCSVTREVLVFLFGGEPR